jgi:hypothetical protein
VKVEGGKVIVTRDTISSTELYETFKRAGFSDQVVLSDSMNINVRLTLDNIRAMKSSEEAKPLLDRMKANIKLVPLKIQEREDQRRTAIHEGNLELEEGEDPEIFDEYEDVIAPLLVDLVRSVPLREKLTNQNKELRIELDKWEDKYDMLTSEKNAEIARLREQLMELSRSTSEERMSLQAENQKLKTQLNNEQTEPDAEEADTIQHVGENNYQLWSLPFQG